MALQVGELFSKLEIRTDGAERDLGRHHAALRDTAQQAGRTERAMLDLGKVVVSTDRYARDASGRFVSMGGSVQRAGQHAATTGNVFQRLGQTITSGVSRAVAGVLNLGNVMRGTGQNAGQMERGVQSGSSALRDMASTSQQTVGALDRVRGAMGNIVSVAAGFVTAQIAMRAMSAAASIMSQAISVEANAAFEQLEIALGHILGDLDKANEILWDLVDVANASPFSYRELTDATRQLAAFGTEADQILPTLQIIGDAVATIGGGGQEMTRVVEMLGRIRMAQRATFSDLNQLATMGINVYEILADQLGTTTDEVIEMAQAGGIVADTVIPALLAGLQQDFAGGMAAQARTFRGAMSQIIDIVRTFQWTMMEAPFRTIRDGLVELVDWLQRGEVQARINEMSDTIASALDGMAQLAVRAIRAIPEAISTLRDGVAGFREFVSGIITGSIGLTDILSVIPGWFFEMVDRVTAMMGIGGHNAIVAYAQGIVDGASQYVTQAINYVADLIASYLVGQSPPPEGPLSQIDAAGRNLMETYTDGMVEGSRGAERAGESIWDVMNRIDEAGELNNANAGIIAAAGNLEAMEAVAGDVEQKIKDINREIAQIDLELAGIDREIDAINRAYDATLVPLNEQLKIFEKQRDLQAEKLQLEVDLQRAQIQAAQLEALGDPERRAEIAGEMALLDIQQQRMDNEKQIADIQQRLDGGPEMSSEERRRLELRQQNLILDRQEAQNRLATDREMTATERQRLANRIATIDLDIEANARRLRGEEELSEAERARLEMQLQELELRQELLDMIDAEASAQAEADLALIDHRQKERELVEQIADIQNDILKMPILEEIAKVEAARRAELEPLELQREELSRQKDDLGFLRQQWQLLSTDVGEALAPLREAARLQEEMARDAERQRKELERAGNEAAKRPDNSFEASQARLRGEASCPPGWVMDEFGRCSNPAEEAWKQAIRDSESGAGAADVLFPDAPTWEDLFPEKDTLEVPVTFVPEVDDVLSVDDIPEHQPGLWERVGESMGEGLVNGIGNYIRSNIGKMLGTAIGGAIGGAVGGPTGFAIGGIIGGLIGDGLQDALVERGIDASVLIGSVRDRVMPALESFTGFISQNVMPVVSRLAGWFAGDGADSVNRFGSFARDIFENYIQPALRRVADDILPAFTEAWERIEPTIGPALENIGRLISWVREQIETHWGTILSVVEPVWSAISRVIRDAISQASRVIAIVLQLIGGDWQGAWDNVKAYLQTTWDLIRDVVRLGVRAVQRFLEEAVPVIWQKVNEWGAALVGWVQSRIAPALTELGKLLLALGTWIVQTGVPALWEKLQEWGTAFIRWIGPKIPVVLEEVGKFHWAILNWIVQDALPAIAEKLLEWGEAFIAWIGPQIPPLLEKLGELLWSLGEWIVTTALPTVVEKLAEWAWAFISWVGPQIPPLLEELGKLLVSLGDWVVTTALPEIVTKLGEWAAAFIGWVHEKVLGEDGLVSKLRDVASAIVGWIGDKSTGAASSIWTKMGEFAAAFVGWVTETVLGTGEGSLIGKLADVLQAIIDWATDTNNLSRAFEAVKSIGTAIVEGIWEGVKSLGSWFKDKVGGWVTDHVPDFIKDRLESDSPARIMYPIGESIPQGLAVGIERGQSELSRRLRAMASAAVDAATISVPQVSSRMALPATAGTNSINGALAAAATNVQVNTYPRIFVGDRELKVIAVEAINEHSRDVY